MSNEPLTLEIQRLKAQLSSLGQLLEVFEDATIEQSDKLYVEIAERKKAEERLSESEERFRTIFDKASDGLLLADPESKRFLMGNEAIGTMLGYSREELGQLGVRDIHPREDLPSTLEGFEKQAKGEIDLTEGRSILRKDGSIFYADIRTCLIKIGTRSYLLGAFRDITERRQAANKIRKLNEELEAALKELIEAQGELVRKEKLAILGQLSGSVGHELRNPLGVMSNAVYFLKMVLSDADETVREYLEIIKHEIDISLQIITDLLDFARTKTPQTMTVPAPQLLDESLAKCLIPENVELHIELADDLPLLRIDLLQMVQVFQNLFLNAFQAMPDGGALRVTARLVDNVRGTQRGSPVSGDHTGSPLQETDDFIEFSVTDTGEGISPENMNKIFQPLFTTKPRGIGLGLVLCKNLTEANGGRIMVESQSGTGTTFIVMLPCERG